MKCEKASWGNTNSTFEIPDPVYDTPLKCEGATLKGLWAFEDDRDMCRDLQKASQQVQDVVLSFANFLLNPVSCSASADPNAPEATLCLIAIAQREDTNHFGISLFVCIGTATSRDPHCRQGRRESESVHTAPIQGEAGVGAAEELDKRAILAVRNQRRQEIRERRLAMGMPEVAPSSAMSTSPILLIIAAVIAVVVFCFAFNQFYSTYAVGKDLLRHLPEHKAASLLAKQGLGRSFFELHTNMRTVFSVAICRQLEAAHMTRWHHGESLSEMKLEDSSYIADGLPRSKRVMAALNFSAGVRVRHGCKVKHSAPVGALVLVLALCCITPLVGAVKLPSWTSSGVLGTPPAGSYEVNIAAWRDKIFCFGGWTGAGYSNDLHVFSTSKTTWTDLSGSVKGTPPVPRWGMGMVAWRDSLYVFGGYQRRGSNRYLNDLHVFNIQGMIWTDKSMAMLGTPPPPRRLMGVAVWGDTLYVFGGQKPVMSNDLHALDLVAGKWTDLSTPASGTPPVARKGMCFAASEGKLFVFSGASSNFLEGDIHAYDITSRTWTDLTGSLGGTLPARRSEGAMAALGSKLYVSMGLSFNQYLSDLHVLDLETMAWTDLTDSASASGTSPQARDGTDLVAAGGLLYLFGGYSSTNIFLNELHAYDPAASVWFQLGGELALSGQEPIPPHVIDPENPSANKPRLEGGGFVEWGDKFYFFGGVPDNKVYENTLHMFDPLRMFWVDLSGSVTGLPPSGRMNFGMVALGNVVYVFGGWGASGFLHDLYGFNPTTMGWTDLSGSVGGVRPEARTGHGMVVSGRSFFVFGGLSEIGYLNDLFEFDPVGLQWKELSGSEVGSPPTERTGLGMVAVGASLYVFGGYAGGTDRLNDLWEYRTDDMSWRELSGSASGAPPQSREKMGMVAWDSKFYVFAGSAAGGSQVLADLFEFNPAGQVWTDLTGAIIGEQPAGRHSMGIVAWGGKLFSYGGAGDAQGAIDGENSDLVVFPLPTTVVVSSFSLVDLALLFDQDSVAFDPAGFFELDSVLDLCVGALPCQLHIDGRGATLNLLPGAVMQCNSLNGCSLLSFQALHFVCSGVGAQASVQVLAGARALLADSMVSGCSSSSQGGFLRLSARSSASVSSCTFEDVHSLESGGVVFAEASDLAISGSTFRRCSSGRHGGAILSTGVLDVRTSVFAGCEAGGWGGALTAIVGASTWVSGTVFEACLSAMGGGAVNALGPLRVQSSSFLGCSSSGPGGAIRAGASNDALSTLLASVSIVDTRWTNCSSEGDGGAVRVEDGKVDIASSAAFSCSARGKGGALSVARVELSMAETVLVENQAQGLGGGALHLSDSTATLTGLAAHGNTAPAGGGGVLFWQGTQQPVVGGWFGGLCGATCPEGTYLLHPAANASGAEAVRCAECPQGTFKSVPGPGSCTVCPAGSYALAGSSSCTACPAGSSVLVVPGEVQSSYMCTCDAGFIGPEGGPCLPCEPGKFKAKAGVLLSCMACPPGEFAGDAGSASCTACPAGTFADSTSPAPSSCSTCPDYTDSPSRSEAITNCTCNEGYAGPDGGPCAPCDPGTFKQDAGSGACVACPTGEHQVLAGSSSCSSCPAGSYHDGPAAVSSCAVCPDHTSSLAGSSDVSECTCDVGYSGPDGGPCTICDAGKFKDVAGSKGCMACAAGSFAAEAGSSVCSVCGAGQYHNGTTAASAICASCPEHSSTTEAGAGSVDKCACNAGYFGPAGGPCVACPAHSSSPAESTVIEDCRCNAGYTGANGGACGACAAGTFKSDSGSGPCTACPANSISGPGSILPDHCSCLLGFTGTLEGRCVPCSSSDAGCNFALYGPCVASDFKALDVVGPSSAYAGVVFQVNIVKLDFYTQQVKTDSISVLRVEASSSAVGSGAQDSPFEVLGPQNSVMQRGESQFLIGVKPTFRSVDAVQQETQLLQQPELRFRGSDAEADSGQEMVSGNLAIRLALGQAVCSRGSVLTLDEASASGFRPGACSQCRAGTYSVDPLSGPGPAGDPGCFACPKGGDCTAGRDQVLFAEGNWTVEGGMYVLKSCPPGHELVSAAVGSSAFDHDEQQCKPCSIGLEYIIDPNLYSCQSCPVGAFCDGRGLQGSVEGSVWVPDLELGVYRLTSCPRGYGLLNQGPDGTFAQEMQECAPCQEGSECVTPSCQVCAPCGPGTYKAVAGTHSCDDCGADTYSSTTGASSSNDCLACAANSGTRGKTGQVAAAACECDVGFLAMQRAANDSSRSCQRCPRAFDCSSGRLQTGVPASLVLEAAGPEPPLTDAELASIMEAALLQELASLGLDTGGVRVDVSQAQDGPSADGAAGLASRRALQSSFDLRLASDGLSAETMEAVLSSPALGSALADLLRVRGVNATLVSVAPVPGSLGSRAGFEFQDGELRITSCPVGHLLVNSSRGVASLDLQGCYRCAPLTYSFDFRDGCNNGLCEPRECQQCPVGAKSDCQASGKAFEPELQDSEWELVQEENLLTMRLKKCPSGHILVRSTSIGSADFDQCVACLAGRYSVAEAVFPSQLSSGNASGATEMCMDCPPHAYCGGGNLLRPDPGYWIHPADREFVNATARPSPVGPRKVTVYKCGVNSCLGMADSLCVPGREGPLCAQCQERWALQGSSCVQCGDIASSKTRYAVLGVLLGLGLVALYTIWRPFLAKEHAEEGPGGVCSEDGFCSNSALFQPLYAKYSWFSQMGLMLLAKFKHSHLTGVFKVWISFWQITSTFGVIYSVPWPEVYSKTWEIASFARVDVTKLPGLGCVVSGIPYLEKLRTTIIIPLVVAFMLGLPSLIMIATGQTKTVKFHDVTSSFWSWLLAWFFLTYPLLSVTSVEAYACVKIEDQNLLSVDLREQCPSDHPTSAIYMWTVFATILYPLSLPLFFLGVLWNFRVPILARKKIDNATLHQMLLLYRKAVSETLSFKFAAFIGADLKEGIHEVVRERAKIMFEKASRGAPSLAFDAFIEYLHSIHIQGDHEEEIRDLMLTFNDDGNGLLDLQDFLDMADEIVRHNSHFKGFETWADLNSEQLELLCRVPWREFARREMVESSITSRSETPAETTFTPFRHSQLADGGDSNGATPVAANTISRALLPSEGENSGSARKGLERTGSARFNKKQRAGLQIAKQIGQQRRQQQRANGNAPAEHASGSHSSLLSESVHLNSNDDEKYRCPLPRDAPDDAKQQWILKMSKHLLFSGAIALPVLRWDGETEEERAVLSSVGFLFNHYKVQFWYFELVEMGRKFVMGALISFIYPGTSLQLFYGLLITVIFLIGFVSTFPFSGKMLNQLQSLAICTQAATLFYGALLLERSLEPSEGPSEEGFLRYLIFTASLFIHLFPVVPMIVRAINDRRTLLARRKQRPPPPSPKQGRPPPTPSEGTATLNRGMPSGDTPPLEEESPLPQVQPISLQPMMTTSATTDRYRDNLHIDFAMHPTDEARPGHAAYPSLASGPQVGSIQLQPRESQHPATTGHYPTPVPCSIATQGVIVGSGVPVMIPDLQAVDTPRDDHGRPATRRANLGEIFVSQPVARLELDDSDLHNDDFSCSVLPEPSNNPVMVPELQASDGNWSISAASVGFHGNGGLDSLVPVPIVAAASPQRDPNVIDEAWA